MRPGVWLAILGPDGSGKSSVIEAVEREAGGSFAGVRRYHLRPHLGRTLDPTPVTDPHGRTPRGRLGSLAKLVLWWADCAVGWLVGIRPALRRGDLVLFDRYVHDILVDPRRYRYGGSARLARRAVGLVPRPDAFVVLDAPVEVLRSRKREVAAGETDRQRSAYRRLADELPGARLVDASRPLEAVAGEVASLARGLRAGAAP